MTSAEDPTRASALRPLKQLLDTMDDDVARFYAERGIAGVRPRFSMALIRLHHLGPLTIRELAAQVEVTHSAMSQSVTAMRAHGLVDTAPGADGRTRVVSLTDRGRRLVPLLEAEWRATEAAVAEVDSELPYPLTRVVQDMTAALARRSFHHRLLAHFQEPEPDR